MIRLADGRLVAADNVRWPDPQYRQSPGDVERHTTEMLCFVFPQLEEARRANALRCPGWPR